ncbi:radical SAM protein [Streptomyces xiamenensis]
MPGDIRAEQISRLLLDALRPGAGEPRELTAWRRALPRPPLSAPDVPAPATAGLSSGRPDPDRYDDHCQPDNCQSGNNCSAACGPEHPRTFDLWLELVEECNLDCLFCYNPWREQLGPAGPVTGLLPPHRLLEVVGTILREIRITHVTLSGGEPLMYPELGRLLSAIRPHVPSISMTTNGRSATRARLTALCAQGVGQFSVPVHSPDPAVHDRLAGGRSWHAAVRALALARELSRVTAMSAVLTSLNWRDAPLLGLMAALLGVRRLVLNCFHPTGQGLRHQDELALSGSRFEHAVAAARERAGDAVTVTIGSPGAGSDRPPPQGIGRLVISPLGELKFCNQSDTGLLNLAGSTDASLRAVLRDLAAGDHAAAIASINHCTCRDPGLAGQHA